MTIAFIHPHKAFMPEIIAYVDFFSAMGVTTLVIKPQEIDAIECDVEWHFMGRHTRRNKHRITIHEYASASVPPFSIVKDRIKQLINTRPDYRIFNNEYVLQQFGNNDKVPYGIRNYGFPSGYHLLPNIEKKYDFVYVGTVDKGRRPELLLNCFADGPLQNHSLLVLSRNYEALQKEYADARNIIFEGPVPYHEIYAHIQQAKFGINYMPDILPYNRQTSAKFIDYAACRLPVITTDYAWVREFQKKYGGNYFYLHPGLSNFTWENISGFAFSCPDVNSWTWEKQIRGSGVLEVLGLKT